MNIQQIKAPVIFFMAGYVFQYIDHFHKSILNHGYTLALMALTACVVLTLLNRKSASNTTTPPASIQDDTILITAQPQHQQTIKLKQKQAVR